MAVERCTSRFALTLTSSSVPPVPDPHPDELLTVPCPRPSPSRAPRCPLTPTLTLTSFSLSPRHLEMMEEALMLKNVVRHSVATALASIVLPVLHAAQHSGARVTRWLKTPLHSSVVHATWGDARGIGRSDSSQHYTSPRCPSSLETNYSVEHKRCDALPTWVPHAQKQCGAVTNFHPAHFFRPFVDLLPCQLGTYMKNYDSMRRMAPRPDDSLAWRVAMV